MSDFSFSDSDRAELLSQARTMFVYTEHSDNLGEYPVYTFSDAGAGQSTYSFGLIQDDVGTNGNASNFLQSIGFTPAQISLLSQQGGLTSDQLASLNAQLQQNSALVDDFSDSQIEVSIGKIQDLINNLNAVNPSVGALLQNNQDLQLALIDYDNQLVINGIPNDPNQMTSDQNSLVAYLEGQSVNLTGGALQLPSNLDPQGLQDAIQNYIDNTSYGVNNPGPVDTRMDNFNDAISVIDDGQQAISDLADTSQVDAFGDLSSTLTGDLTWAEQSNGTFTIVGADGSVIEVPGVDMGVQLLNGAGQETFLESLDPDGNAIYTQSNTFSSSGAISSSEITGVGDLAYLSNANVTLDAGAQANVVGTSNTLSLESGAGANLSGGGNTIDLLNTGDFLGLSSTNGSNDTVFASNDSGAGTGISWAITPGLMWPVRTTSSGLPATAAPVCGAGELGRPHE